MATHESSTGTNYDIAEHKRAESELRASEARLKGILASATDGIVSVDSQQRITLFNAAAERMFGYSADEVMGQSLDRFLLPASRAVHEQLVRKFGDSGVTARQMVTQRELKAVRASGEVFPIEASISHFTLDGGERVYTAIVRDISDRLREAETLRRTNEYLTLATTAGGVGIWDLDVVANVLTWNAQMFCLYGMTPEHFGGAYETWAASVHPDDRARADAEVQMALRGERAFDTEFRVVWPDHSVHHLRAVAKVHRDPAGVPVRLVGIDYDITEPKQTEVALRKSEAQHRAILRTAVVGFLLSDPQGRILEANETYCEMIGYTERDLLTMRISDLEAQYSVDKTAAKIQLVIAQGPQRFETRHRRKDGSVLDIEVRAHFSSASGGQLVVFLQDITARNLAEVALRESQQRLRDLVDSTDGIVWEADATTFTFASISGNAERILGYPVSDWLQPGFWASHILAEDRDEAVDYCVASTRRLQDHAFEYRFVARDQRIVWLRDIVKVVHENGTPRWLRGLMIDITETKRTEQALRESEEHFRVVIDTALDAVITIAADDSVIAWNANAERMFGWTRQEVIGRSLVQFIVPPLHRAAHRRGMQRFLDEGVGPLLNRRIELTGLRKNGEEFPVELAITPARVGNATFFSAFLRDLTAQKQVEAERIKLEAQLHHAQKMESVGRLAGGVAHDFNNMLGVILGNVELAMLQVEPSQPLHADLEEIRKAAVRSADLTRQLLAFARRQTLAPMPLSLNETVPDMLTMLQRLIGEAIQLFWQSDAKLWPLHLDPSQMDQILTNLCVNARDAIAGVGTISIAAANQIIDQQFCSSHEDAAPGEYVRLTVRDSGCGMDSETLSQIFEPFFTTKGVGEGTGLGLATVYGAVRQNHGFITVSSEKGHGTSFDIYLPRYMGGNEPLTQAAPPDRGGRETVLVVEDEAGILTLTTRALEAKGYTVLGTTSPGDAVRLASEHVGDIQLLLTDVIMPRMNGRDLADKLVQQHPHLKVLFMSGHSASIIGENGVLGDETHFIGKPFTLDALVRKVRGVLDHDRER